MSDADMNADAGDNFFELEIVDDVKVSVPPSLYQITCFVLLEQEDWFEEDIHFVRKLAADGLTMLDIGANLGLYTLAAAKAAGGQGRFWAIEPTSTTYDLLTRSVARNGFEHVRCLHMALSDHVGEGYLSIRHTSEVNALLDEPDEGAETVNLSTLDALMAEELAGQVFDFVKLDAEGAEEAILRGGARFFAEQSPLVMFEFKHITEFNQGLLQAFKKLDMDVYYLVPGLNILAPVSGNIEFSQLNLYACNRQRAEQLSARGLLVLDAEQAKIDAASLPVAEWNAFFQYQLWALDFSSRWLGWGSTVTQSQDIMLREAIGRWMAAQDTSLSADQRYGHLALAFQLAWQFRQAAPERIEGIFTFARIAVEFGLRVPAHKALAECLEMIRTAQVRIGGPFLAPIARFDSIQPGQDFGDWLICSAAEGFDRYRHYSSLFVKPIEVVEVIKMVQARRFFGIGMLRRLALLIMREGANPRQVLPAALTERLLTASSDHRNAAVWRFLLSEQS